MLAAGCICAPAEHSYLQLAVQESISSSNHPQNHTTLITQIPSRLGQVGDVITASTPTALLLLWVNLSWLSAGLPVTAVVTATALSSVVASLICGLGANLPVGLSPGMGLNAYLVFSQVCPGDPPAWKSFDGNFIHT